MNEIQYQFRIVLAVHQQPIRIYVAFTAAFAVSLQRMVAIFTFKLFIPAQFINDSFQFFRLEAAPFRTPYLTLKTC